MSRNIVGLNELERMAKRQAKRDAIPQKVCLYKGFVIAYIAAEKKFQVFTREEWAYGEGLRNAEFDDCGSLQEAKDNL